MKPLKPEKEKPTPGLMEPEYKSWDDRDKLIQKYADYFTVGRRIGPGQGYDRHEVKTLEEAEKLARRMADSNKKTYMIYAVKGISDCFVKAFHPK